MTGWTRGRLCLRLSRYLDGQREELRATVRVPSRAERERREVGRQREFWKKRGAPVEKPRAGPCGSEHEYETLSAARWAWPRRWKRLQGQLSDFWFHGCSWSPWSNRSAPRKSN